ncbi:BadF/BadG/BcrA/BcrD ATPase family protein [Endozoicomonas sp. SCSIO W0465]|uniref:BadF/BadG/BcrA/BcrD ATPase family protein n=1 Tax=Endozoicomonas sp. SCSIO W0465 TaxID=2918516 RepID=UPI002074AF0A|nr:BadF/BadG/BcrA/BcrD ATPase family protein [Endozoicomonas sp. SCSIO W0465]USE37143.1 N-acetylglucosamine kinase [Endozoicomonas sp. SCSIO W0465]
MNITPAKPADVAVDQTPSTLPANASEGSCAGRSVVAAPAVASHVSSAAGDDYCLSDMRQANPTELKQRETTYWVGVDGGGTKTAATIFGQDGKVLGRGKSGCSNTCTVGVEDSAKTIMTAVHEALAKADLKVSALGSMYAGIGLAGVNQEPQRSQMQNYKFPFAGFYLDTDVYSACLGAFDGKDGAILILGTGSCGGIMNNGELTTLAGWGFPISDQASGARLGLAAIQYALKAHEGIKDKTPLSEEIMATLFHNRAEDAVGWQQKAKPADYGKVAELITRHLKQGDALAKQLMQGAAEEAAEMIRCLLKRGASGCALVGGLSGHIKPFLPEDLARVTFIPGPDRDALHGALKMAEQAYLETVKVTHNTPASTV